MAIDWNFLGEVEGSALNRAYIPMKDGKPIQSSGVTVGTGVDLGAQEEGKLRSLGLSDQLIGKLKPYLGKKRQDAVDALNNEGQLTLSDDEVQELDRAIKQDHLRFVRNWFNKNNTQGMDWSDLTDRQQTVVLSVEYNHGQDALKKYNFGKQVANNEWDKVADNLRNFYGSPDNELHSRRIKELQYLTGAAVDGVAGGETDTKLDEFKTAFQQQGSVPSLTNQPTPAPSLRDVRPNTEDTRGPMEDLMTGFLDNLTAAIGQRLEAPQRASQEPTEARTAPEDRQKPRNRGEALLQRGAQGLKQSIEGGEKALERTFNEVMLEEEAEEAKEEPSRRRLSLLDRAVDQERQRRARGTKETMPPVKVNRGTMEDRDDSKDPTYGLF